MEKELGATIVNRKQTPFTLTEAGQIYYQYLENVSAQRQKLNSRLERYSEQYRDREIIRITILETLDNNIQAYINEGEPYYVVIPARSKFFIPGEFILDPSTYDLKTLL